jgi:hypothetical protein
MTVLGPAARLALLSLSFIYRDQLSKLWECGSQPKDNAGQQDDGEGEAQHATIHVRNQGTIL